MANILKNFQRTIVRDAINRVLDEYTLAPGANDKCTKSTSTTYLTRSQYKAFVEKILCATKCYDMMCFPDIDNPACAAFFDRYLNSVLDDYCIERPVEISKEPKGITAVTIAKYCMRDSRIYNNLLQKIRNSFGINKEKLYDKNPINYKISKENLSKLAVNLASIINCAQEFDFSRENYVSVMIEDLTLDNINLLFRMYGIPVVLEEKPNGDNIEDKVGKANPDGNEEDISYSNTMTGKCGGFYA